MSVRLCPIALFRNIPASYSSVVTSSDMFQIQALQDLCNQSRLAEAENEDESRCSEADSSKQSLVQ